MKNSSRRLLPLLALTNLLTVKPLLAAAVIWSGVDATGNINTNWSDANNWSGGTPGATTSIQFFNAGAASAVNSVNNIVDTTTTVLTLQYANTNNFHTTLINPGVTLNVTNSAAGYLFEAGTLTDNGASQIVNATVTGSGGTLALTDTNTASLVQVQQGAATSGSHIAILDLSGLGTLNLTAGRLLVAANPGSGINASNYNAGTLNLARTNLIQLAGTAPALLVGDTISNPNTNLNLLQLGQTNALFVDSITIGRTKQSGAVKFNPVFSGNNPALYLRGKTTTRVTTLAIGDYSNQTGGTGSSSTSSGIFDLSAGWVDAQINNCYISRGQVSTNTGGATGTLSLGAGVFNVNTLSLASASTNNANANIAATVNVTGTATLVVNGNLVLGTNPNTNALFSKTATANLNITNGTVFANTINSGSTNGVIANINVNNGQLTVTNAAGTPGQPIAALNLTNAALHLIANLTLTNIVATNVNGTATITIDYIGYAGGTATYPLISYASADPFANLTLAALGAYTGTLVDNTAAKRIDLQITSGPVTPILGSIVWGGNVNNNWDTSSLNWTNNGVTTVYADSDFVTLNDLGRTGNLNLATTIAPASVTVSNTALNYTISGSGNLGGSGDLIKSGTGTLTLGTINTYGGSTYLNSGTIKTTVAGALPATTAVNFNAATNVTLDLQGTAQTVGNLIFNNVGASSVTVTGTSGSALTVSPATLLIAPLTTTNSVSLNLSALSSFSYNNSAGTITANNGSIAAATSAGQTTVTLAAGTNSITANTLNLGNSSASSGVLNTKILLGSNNFLKLGTLNVGNGRSGGIIQFATNLLAPTLTIAGTSGGTSLANLSFGGHDSYQASDSPVDLIDTTAGTLTAQFGAFTMGRSAPTANMTANRGISSLSTFKMGAGTFTAANVTLGVINAAAGDNGSYTYNLTNNSVLSFANGSVANITNLTLANNNYAGNFTTSSKLSAIVSLTNGAILNAATIQEGTITAPNQGTLNVIPELLFGDGTLGNLPGANLTVNGVFFVLANTNNNHNVNISAGQTGQINAWISGNGSLSDVGAGALILNGQNSFNGALIMASTNTLTLSAANTYTGNTVISNGTLAISGSGSLTSPNIIVQSNAVFDVSAVAPFTLGANTNQNLVGNGSVNGSLMVNAGSQIIPGGTSVAGTLTFSNDLTLNGQSITFDLSSSPTGNNDLINLGGTLNLNGNVTIWINMLNNSLSSGTYTLMNYSALAANGFNFVLVAPRGMTLSAGPTALTLNVATVSNANLTWVGDATANNWDVQTTTNWLNAGNLDFFYQLDNVTFTDTGSAAPAVNLTSILVPSSVTVNAAQNYTFNSTSGGQFAGSMTLTKNGTGTLFLQTSNTYTGGTVVNKGTLELDLASAAGPGAINLGNNSLNVNIGADTLLNTVSGSGNINVLATPDANCILGGSLANFTGVINVPASPSDTAKTVINNPAVNLNSAATINIASGGTLYTTGSGVIISATNQVSGSGNSENLGALRVDGGSVLAGPVKLLGDTTIGETGTGTISGGISDGGSGFAITKVGGTTSTLYLLGTNTYAGGTTISSGILSIGNGVVNGSLPTLPGTVTNNATLQYNVISNTTVTAPQQILGTGGVNKLGDGILALSGSNGFAGGINTGSGAGSGTSGGIIRLLNSYGFGDPGILKTAAVIRAEVRLEGGITLPSNVYLQTSANSALTGAGAGYVALHNLGGTNTITGTVELISGAGNSEFSSDAGWLVFNGPVFLGNTSSRTAVLGGAANGLVNGVLSNQPTNALAIQKTGTGTWTLAAANTYTGTTTVSGGTLLVNGSVANGAVTVQTNGTLGGSGSIGGTVTVQASGSVQGGDANYANTLTLTALNLGTAGTSLTSSRFNLAAGGQIAAGTLSINGTNTVQILDSSLTVGTNTLFTYAGSIGGTSGFAGLQLGTLPSGVTAQLLNTGSAVQLAVTSVSTVNTNSPVLTKSVSGNTLTLSWPADHLGWRLLVQTNSLTVGLHNNWVTWPNSTNLTSVPFTLNPANPSVFFRLVYP